MWYKQMLHINDIYFGNQQREGENIVQFVTRLHQVSEGNNYGAELENQIRDQIVQSCKLNDLRRKLMAKGDMLTFGETLKIACSFEVLETQIQTMRLDGGSKVNKITFTGIRKGLGHGKGHSKAEDDCECFRCGNFGNIAKDSCCPIRGQTGRRCGEKKPILQRSVDLQTNQSEMMEKQIHLEEEEGERWMR